MKNNDKYKVLRKIDVLVVAEKNSVAKAISSFLAEGRIFVRNIGRIPLYIFSRRNKTWVCIGLKGHLMNYDFHRKYNSWRNVDPRVLFFTTPIRVVIPENREYVRALELLGRISRFVVLALDADVEGEAIAFEAMSVIRKVNPKAVFKRAWFSALTRKDILEAFQNLRDPNPLLANKVFARMIIDLTIGAAFTRFLTLTVEKKKVFPKGMFLSYGPCQSPVLYFVVKRELERENFKKKKYYTFELFFRKRGETYRALYAGEKIFDRKIALQMFEKLRKSSFVEVVEAVYKKRIKRSPVPLNTIELERNCSRFLNIRSKETLTIAEELYRHGLISYPRTETTIYPPTLNLRNLAKMFIRNPHYGDYVERYVLAKYKLVPTRGREDDKAHPPIYPVKSVRLEDVRSRFGVKAAKIYDYIVRHFLATLSDPAVVESQIITLKAGGFPFRMEGLRVLNEGYYRIFPFERPKEKDLGLFQKGEVYEILNVNMLQKTTTPPPHLSEAELLRLMKIYGIGTDATMQEHIYTNIKRKYMLVKGKKCIPTELGKALILSLKEVVPEIVNPEVRGKIESFLAQIPEKGVNPQEVVETVKSEFLDYFDRLREKENELQEKLLYALERMGDYYTSSNKDNNGRRSTRKT
ncbi:MAG: type IA DNA topoisomerase [Thermoprotei archaeon]|nr:MAG: type IA DNA topoisomerase [Thermoprotei archaeon]